MKAPKMTSSSPLRVAAYIRVSTDSRGQEDSYEIQSTYFSRLLCDNPLWIPAGIYADRGISGTSRERRIGFDRLIRHCTEGRIDHIVTKSISRFARNTSDFLKVLDILKKNHVTIAFEKEHLDTSIAQNDLMLTIFGAVAQEESRCIAASVTAGLRRRYPNGETKNIALYGYRYKEGADAIQTMDSGYSLRRIEIVEKEATVVRRIFCEAIEGDSFIKIARGLNRDQIPAPRSAVKTKHAGMKQTPAGVLDASLDEGWTSRHIKQILRLERYCGDVLLQKTYKPDHKSPRVYPNRGELPRYHVRDHHPPIISRDTFQKAQKILAGNAAHYGHPSAPRRTYPLSGRLACSHCGRFYHTRNRGRRPIWFCASTKQNNGKDICRAERIYEEEVLRLIRQAAIDRFIRPSICGAPPSAGSRSSEPLYTSADISSLPSSSIGTQVVTQILEKMERIQMADTAELDRIFFQPPLSEAPSDRSRHFERSKCLERYWSALENDYTCRKKAAAWMRTLDEQADFLAGLTGPYLKAFILSIEVRSPTDFCIRWFDNTLTKI